MPIAIKVSHLDKVSFPEAGVTKGDLIEHYRSVAARMLSHVHDRPMAVARYPDASVATPLEWSELEDGNLIPQRFTVRTMGRRLAEPDPWRTTPDPVSSPATAQRRPRDLPG